MSLMLAAAILLQDKVAEDTFNKIQESILSAKSISTKYTYERFKDGVRAESLRGSLLLKEGNKGKLAYLVQGKPTSMTSDGNSLNVVVDGKTTVNGPTYPAYHEDLSLAVARIGISAFYTLTGRIKGKATPLKDFCTVDNFKLDPKEGEIRTLTYQLHLKDLSEIYEVELFYRAKDFQLTKRAIRTSLNGGKFLFEEKYEDFTLNKDISDDTFKVPEDKK
jgi:outer membrane lipoprotein-sorting protein